MKQRLAALILLSAAIPTIQAGIVLSDTFTYPNGNLVGATGSPWATHSGATPVMVVDGKARLTGGSTEDVNASLAGAPYLESDPSAFLYSSYTLVVSNLPGVGGTYITHFRGTNTAAATDFGARVWVSTTNAYLGTTVPAGKFRVGIGNGTQASAATGQVDQDLDTNVTYTIVTRFQPGDGTNSTIWVNPTAESDPSVTATDVGTPTRPNSFNVFTYALRQASGCGTVYIDNLKVGTAFNDVAGANTAPLISSIPNQSTPANTAIGPLGFTVQDAETPASSLVVYSDSSNTGLVPTNNIVFGGGDTNRTVTITPMADVQGQAIIALYVFDGGNTSSTSFQLTVGAPSLSSIANQTVRINQSAGPLAFTVSDAESSAGSLVVTAASSNPNLVPNAPANLTLGGSGADRTLTVTPAANTNGVATITVSVSDGVNTTSTTFIFVVSPVVGLVFSDEFSYTTFQLGSALYGATDSPWQHHSGNFYELQVMDGQAELSGGLGEDLNAALTSAPFIPADGWVLYTSFKLTYLDLPNTSSEYFLHLRDNGSGFRACVVATTNGVTAGKYRVGIANQSSSSAGRVLYPQDLDPNTIYAVVTRYNVGSSVSTLWVNPANESSASVTATDLPNTQSISTIALRQSGGIGTNHIDSLKVGTSFTDVFTVVAPSPEPLNVQLAGGNVVLTWNNAAFSLQAAPTVSGTYTNVPGATSPYTNSPAGERYFRLKF